MQTASYTSWHFVTLCLFILYICRLLQLVCLHLEKKKQSLL